MRHDHAAAELDLKQMFPFVPFEAETPNSDLERDSVSAMGASSVLSKRKIAKLKAPPLWTWFTRSYRTDSPTALDGGPSLFKSAKRQNGVRGTVYLSQSEYIRLGPFTDPMPDRRIRGSTSMNGQLLGTFPFVRIEFRFRAISSHMASES